MNVANSFSYNKYATDLLQIWLLQIFMQPVFVQQWEKRREIPARNPVKINKFVW